MVYRIYSYSLMIVGYSDIDQARHVEDRKNTSSAFYFYFISVCFVAWLSMKQNSISLSTVETEYIVVENCCMQLLWMKQMLKDYGIEQGTMSIHCDNSSVINISKNPIFHSHTKHIEIHHHFIRDLVEAKGCFFRVCPPLNIN